MKKPFDPAAYLDNEETARAYLEACEGEGDDIRAAALADIARAQAMVRPYAIPGVLMSGELIADRRAEAAKEEAEDIAALNEAAEREDRLGKDTARAGYLPIEQVEEILKAADPQFKSDAHAAIHDDVKGMHEVGAVDEATVRRFNESCLTTDFQPEEN